MELTEGNRTAHLSSQIHRRRWKVWFRFSLRTLLIVTVFFGSCGAVWMKREPWTMTYQMELPKVVEASASPDGHQLSILEDTSISIFDFDKLTVTEKASCDCRYNRVIWSADSRRFMTTNKESNRISSPGDTFEYAVWQASPLKVVCILKFERKSPGTEHEYVGCELSPDGKLAYTNVNELQCVDVDSGRVLWRQPKPDDWARLDPTGRFLTTGADLLDAKTGTVLWSVEPKLKITLWDHAFTQDGRLFALLVEQPNPSLQVFETSPFRKRCNVMLDGTPRYLRFLTKEILSVHVSRDLTADVEEFRNPIDGAVISGTTDDAIQLPHGLSPSGRHYIYSPVTHGWNICDRSGHVECDLPACTTAEWISGGRVLCSSHYWFSIWSFVHSAGPLGFLALPEFWLALLCLIGVIFSIRADRKRAVA